MTSPTNPLQHDDRVKHTMNSLLKVGTPLKRNSLEFRIEGLGIQKLSNEARWRSMMDSCPSAQVLLQKMWGCDVV